METMRTIRRGSTSLARPLVWARVTHTSPVQAALGVVVECAGAVEVGEAIVQPLQPLCVLS